MAEVVLGSHGGITERAADMLARLLSEQPENVAARLLQVELLARGRSAKVQQLLAPAGETPLSLLEKLLAEQPDSEECKRAYVRLASMPQRGSGAHVQPALAANYAQELLATSAADSELIMLFLSARDLYARQLAAEGNTEAARSERERTLGILSFVTARNDFTPTMRDKLVHWVAMHDLHGDDAAQHEQELRTLLKDYDAERIQALRARLHRMRRAPRQRPGYRFRRPGAR